MRSKVISVVMLILLLTSMLTLASDIRLGEADGPIYIIYIRADGSVEPDTTPISTIDNVTYTFTDNISSFYGIVIERDNVVVNGAGYILQGTGSGKGVDLTGRHNVTIKGTKIKGFKRGIYIHSASNNTICGNNITNNGYGIDLLSSNNIFRSNRMVNNTYNFQVGFLGPSHFINDVDTSNTVNDKPVYYWIGKQDLTVPLDAGYVVLANCINITVQGLTITNNGEGLLLAFTTNSKVSENNITESSEGIHLYYSSNNKITGNTITNSDEGIHLGYSSSNKIYGNVIANSGYNGIGLVDSSYNDVSGNTVANSYQGIDLLYSWNNEVSGNEVAGNGYGISLRFSFDNKIFHNNLIDNTNQAFELQRHENTWSNGYPSGGNYWSDHNSTDVYSGPYQNLTDSDGIGDTPYNILWNNQDNYPLIHPYGYVPSPDLDDDGIVNILDGIIIAVAFGSRPGDPNWNPMADILVDSIINIQDILLWAIHFGETL